MDRKPASGMWEILIQVFFFPLQIIGLTQGCCIQSKCQDVDHSLLFHLNMSLSFNQQTNKQNQNQSNQTNPTLFSQIAALKKILALPKYMIIHLQSRNIKQSIPLHTWGNEIQNTQVMLATLIDATQKLCWTVHEASSSRVSSRISCRIEDWNSKQNFI